MKSICDRGSAIAAVVMFVCVGVGASNRADGDAGTAADIATAIRAAADAVEPSVVTIETIGGAMPPDGPGRRSFQVADGPTTGVVYGADGLIITSSFNFVRDPSVITVTLADERQFVAELLARDEIRKLAMLRIDADELAAADWASERDVRVGASACALGRGFGGERPALSVGIVSAVGRFDGLAVQTDAKLSPANYGGPLLDLDGRVIGISVPMGPSPGELAGVELYDSGVGFAIPGWQIVPVAERLARGESIRSGKIGVMIADAEPSGVRVTSVAEQSPGRDAGIEVGDRIVAIEGKSIADLRELKRVMSARAAGDVVVVELVREDEALEVQVTLRVMSEISGFTQPGAPASQPATAPSSRPSTRPAR